MIWYEIEIKTTIEAEEAVSEFFYDLDAKGVVIESAEDLEMILSDPTVNYIDEKILNMDSNTSVIKGYFHEDTEINRTIDTLRLKIEQLPEFGLDPGEFTISLTEKEEEDWANSWKQFYKPTRIGKHIIVKPLWEDLQSKEEDLIIDIDPGMAFGTGTHETTRLCIEALEKTVKPGDIVYDVGCGTGILSVAAVRLGSGQVIGIDLDPVAVKVAEENLELNGVAEDIEIRLGNLVDVLQPNEQADVIVANILAEAIVELCDDIRPHLKNGGIFISSGIINDRVEIVIQALEKNNFSVQEINTQGEWNGIIAVKEA